MADILKLEGGISDIKIEMGGTADICRYIYFDAAELARLEWPRNSPNLNIIEPCWPYFKRVTTKKEAPAKRADMENLWLKAWDELK